MNNLLSFTVVRKRKNKQNKADGAYLSPNYAKQVIIEKRQNILYPKPTLITMKVIQTAFLTVQIFSNG